MLVTIQAGIPGQIPANSIPGMYRMSTGFEAYGLLLRTDSTAVFSYRPDHAGGNDSNGKWSFDGNLVRVKLTTIKGKKRTGHLWKLVPIQWGERQYLVLEGEVRDFAGMAMSWADSHRDLRSQRSEMYRAPLMKADGHTFKKRFGTPKAPERYAPWFDWK